MRDRRVRLSDPTVRRRLFDQKRYTRPLPESTLVLIPQDEMVRRIEVVRANTARCWECGGPVS